MKLSDIVKVFIAGDWGNVATISGNVISNKCNRHIVFVIDGECDRYITLRTL